ncbi:50S ribosomal protein L29 [Planctomycetota bacterium]
MKNILQLKEWRGKSQDELLTEVSNLKEELFRLRLRKVTDVIENPALIKELKRDIARVKTVLKEKGL